MVVWQGITEGGTAVPVQITEEGKVVAIGETGPEGPPGPPGQAEWPPNPIEGAFLVWLNGEPTWYTEQPIPTPPGIAGPIIQVDQNSLLLFESNVDQNIFFQGVQVYAVNADGSNWNGDGQYNTSQVWSDAVISSTPFTRGSLAKLFDGSTVQYPDDSCGLIQQNPPGEFILTFPDIENVTKVEIGSYSPSSSSNNNFYQLNSQTPINTWTGSESKPYNLVLYNGAPITLQTIKATASNTGVSTTLDYIKVNGKVLLDPSAGPYPTGQISTVANNSVLLSRVQGVWTEGLYMKADEGAQAAWLISKRRNGKILG